MRNKIIPEAAVIKITVCYQRQHALKLMRIELAEAGGDDDEE